MNIIYSMIFNRIKIESKVVSNLIIKHIKSYNKSLKFYDLSNL